MTGYYTDLRIKMDAGDYKSAAKFVEDSKGKYGKKNVLLFYLDAGFLNHLAQNYMKSADYFESAKRKFEEYYQKSITAGAASMIYNDMSMAYYGQNFERVHIGIFEALDYILAGQDNEAAVEARQSNTLFRRFAVENSNKNFYKDDAFIRYFMGLVYENAGYVNDAYVSYARAIDLYRTGIVPLAVPQDLIDSAYSAALYLGMNDRAGEIKSRYPSAQRKIMPDGYGELIIINYNGFMPKKIDNVLEFALFDIWPYINQVQIDDDKERRDFEKARSVTISAFASDYVKVSFPKYEKIPSRIYSFGAAYAGGYAQGYTVQDLGTLAQKNLEAEVGKIYAKTLARAAVKYAIGKSVSKAVSDKTNSGWGLLTQIAFNVYNSLSETADKRAWNTLPETIQMSRMYLPEGINEISVEFKDAAGNVMKTENIEVEIKKGGRTFAVLRSAM
ncbi:MAG: hypothetical protein FWC57_02470 [Endomicrobia bacterium]|nr:hypothetical protein [Endomicrobiia bacterium]